MPIVAVEIKAVDAQGCSVTLFFHENKDKHGTDCTKVFGVSNCRVLCKDTTVIMSIRAQVHLLSTFNLLDSLNSSRALMRSRPASVATELMPTS